MDTEPSRRCILCGGSRFQTCFADSCSAPEVPGEAATATRANTPGEYLRTVRCSHCGLMFRVTPSSSAEKASRPGLNYLPACDDPAAPAMTSPAVREAVISTAMGRCEIEEICSFTRPPGTFLNVGSDSAGILETARLQGWNSAAVAWLEETTSEKPNSLFELPLQRLKYDVIRLEGSLENSPDPREHLGRVRRLLRRNGLLVIATPDCSSWDFTLYGQGASLFGNELPTWFFTPRTLKRLLVNSGFKVLKVTNFQVEYELQKHPLAGATPPDLAGDGITGDFLPSATLPYARYFRVLARLDEKRISQAYGEKEREVRPEAQLDIASLLAEVTVE